MPAETSLRDAIARVQQLPPEERVRLILGLNDHAAERFTARFTREQCKLKSLDVLSDTTARAVYTFTVEDFYCNGSGNLHGGAQALFFDLCTSLALHAIGRKDFWLNGGVSRVLTVNYIRPAPVGLEVEMDCEITHAGRNLAILRGVLRRASDGAVLSTCEHTKVAVAEKPQWKL